MSTSIQTDLESSWRELSRRNDWQLVGDEAYFLEQAALEFHMINAEQTTARRVQVALKRAYGEILYNELAWNNERAAAELWYACQRLALRDPRTREMAEDLAQETLTRVLEKLDSLRDPKSLIGWALRIFSDVQRRALQREDRYVATDDTMPEAADPADIADDVEQGMIRAEFDALVRQALPNQLEREALVRVLIDQQKPCEVAAALGLPPHRVRLAKSRGLQRLRAHPRIRQLLQELLGRDAMPDGQEGENHDD